MVRPYVSIFSNVHPTDARRRFPLYKAYIKYHSDLNDSNSEGGNSEKIESTENESQTSSEPDEISSYEITDHSADEANFVPDKISAKNALSDKISVRFNKRISEILIGWFIRHKKYPYPSQDEKVKLADQADLSVSQVGYWFTNKRKRHWTPVFKNKTRAPRDKFEFALLDIDTSKNSIKKRRYTKKIDSEI
mmetsp:Transcript_7736/g.11661  ORF Transcript_7736/g.11661 Transcript_7736/m.11661 type:complete len:192 (+) Transcript_7736:66-641(+)|eukprot:CAMPEP_0171454554 /NCGR_PEP_ID=MMETSP0945-20130129/1788_1 /TAXON_ID=109269 /ORGANISM="Vaucheria litorea, Strain CCMP2940" /LENGTH=191 /DNA_ID=CAMNT_0011979589 /DNA_START=49 /DNA_END=624 /DNA_ORIENTATION=-